MKTLIIADSRGARLARHLNNTSNISDYVVTTHPGAGLIRATNASYNTMRATQPDIVIIMAGICDVTQKDPVTKEISPRYTDLDTAIDGIMGSIRQAHQDISKWGPPNVSFATLTGVDLTDVNNKERRHMSESEYHQYCADAKEIHPGQCLLNETILATNRAIIAFNESNRMPTTWLSEVIHPLSRGRHRFYYGHLRDGCHPTETTSKRWATQIIRAIRKIAKEKNIASKAK